VSAKIPEEQQQHYRDQNGSQPSPENPWRRFVILDRDKFWSGDETLCGENFWIAATAVLALATIF
jgi:hypothetical protein